MGKRRHGIYPKSYTRKINHYQLTNIISVFVFKSFYIFAI